MHPQILRKRFYLFAISRKKIILNKEKCAEQNTNWVQKIYKPQIMHEMSSWCLFWLHLKSFYGILYKLLIFLFFCENIFVSLQKDFFLYTVSRKHFGTALFWTSKNNICICCEDKNRYPLSIHDMNLSISIKSIQIQVMHKHIFLVLSTQTYGMLDRKKQ